MSEDANSLGVFGARLQMLAPLLKLARRVRTGVRLPDEDLRQRRAGESSVAGERGARGTHRLRRGAAIEAAEVGGGAHLQLALSPDEHAGRAGGVDAEPDVLRDVLEYVQEVRRRPFGQLCRAGRSQFLKYEQNARPARTCQNPSLRALRYVVRDVHFVPRVSDARAPGHRQESRNLLAGDLPEAEREPELRQGARRRRPHLRAVPLVKKYAITRTAKNRHSRRANLSPMDDALGETRAGRALGLLPTTHFETVDRALWACFNLVEDADFEKKEFVRRTMARARSTDQLFVKKFFILSGMCMFQEMRMHYKESCDVEKFDWWYNHLRQGFRMYFFGSLKEKENPKKKNTVLDAYYPTLELFVVKMIAAYLTA